MVEGEEFGPYRLQRLIGRGGMGEVFEAHDVVQDRQVAVKRLLAHMADDESFQQRFRRESRVAARLRSPHVIPIHTYGDIEGRLFLDMRLVDGVDLQRLIIQEGRLCPERAVSIIGQVASALDSAHREGLVHRDVKPSNILLDRDAGDEDFVYLADFGITRASAPSQQLTASHVVVGSLQYMAPEQFDGTAGGQADIYSLGCVLFQCLTGTTPFPVDGLPSLMKAHLSHDPPAPSQRCGEVPAALDPVIERALAKDPAMRYATAGEFAKDARAALDQSSATAPVGVLAGTGAGSSHGDSSHGDSSGTDPSAPGSTALLTSSRPGGPTSAGDGRATGELDAGAGGTDVYATDNHGTDNHGTDVHGTGPAARPAGGGPGSTGRAAAASRRRRGILALVVAALVVLVVLGVVVATATSGPSAPGTAADPARSAALPPDADQPAQPAASLDQPAVTGTFPAGTGPETVALSPDGRSAYLTVTGDNPGVEVIDVSSGRILETVPTPGPPYFVALSPSGEHAYVTVYDRTASQLVVGTMDTRVNQFDGFIPTGQQARQGSLLTWLFGLAITPDGSRIYVPNHNASAVSVLDTEQKRSVAEIPVPNTPHWVALTPDGRFAYVTQHMPGQVTVIDTATNAVVTTIPIGPDTAPHSVAVSPDGRVVESVNYDNDSVTFIDPGSRTVTGTIPVGEEPQSIAFAPDGAHSYVVNESSKSVSVISTRDRRVTATVPAGEGASMIAVAPDGHTGVVANKEGNTITVLDLGAHDR